MQNDIYKGYEKKPYKSIHINPPFINNVYDDYNPAYVKSKHASVLAALGHMGVSGLVHVAQNQLAKKFLTSKAQTSLYRNMFHHGMKGVNPGAALGSVRGIKSTLVPEIGVLSQVSQKFGSNFAKRLKDSPLGSYDQLNSPQRLFLRDLAAGDFHKIGAKIHIPEYKQLFNSFTQSLKDSSTKPEIKTMVDNIYQKVNKPYERGGVYLQELSNQYKKSKVSKIMPELFKDLSLKESMRLSQASAKGKGLAHLPSEVVGNAMIYQGDPAAAGFNVLKRFISSPTIKKTPILNKVQNKISKKMMRDPLKKAWEQGLQGAYKEPRGFKKFVHRDLINPLHDDINNLTGNIGNTIHKAQQPERRVRRAFIPRSSLPQVRKPKSF